MNSYLAPITLLLMTTIVCGETPLIKSITKETVWQNRDGKSSTWFHPRACMTPGVKGESVAFMTLQTIGGSDYFGPVQWCQSTDSGKTWSPPLPIPALGRALIPGREKLKAGVCDVVPQYHPPTQTVLALGHVVFYSGKRFSKGEQLPRYPLYSVRSKDGIWSERRKLEWDDPRGAFIYTNNCGQRVVLPNGDILMAFTFGDKSNGRSVAGVLCSFDGELLKVKKVGPPLTLKHGRGLLEPSVTEFQGRYFITIRAEDGRGYHSVSDDGLYWNDKNPWTWDDGQPVAMSTTQQHWLTHSDGLFLVYTRKDKTNTGIIRWRAPLFVAQVDPGKRCLIRATEQIALPLVGDGVNDPSNVALMGNFHVTNVSADESWITVGEWMPKKSARGDLLMARIRWSKPNRIAGSR